MYFVQACSSCLAILDILHLYLIILEIDPRERGIDVGAILGWVGNDIAIIAILL